MMPETTTPATRSDTNTRRGLQPMASLMWKVASPALRKRGLSEARIVTDWAEIVGPLLARATSPDRLKTDARDAPGVLHVRAVGPVATEVQHLAPQIVERINAYFGYRAVDRLHIVQAPPRTRRRRRPAEPATLDDNTRNAVEARVAAVSDDALRDALARLGLAIEGHNRKRP
jgi:hypothetical protein